MFFTRIVSIILVTWGCMCAQSSPAFIASDVHQSPPNTTRDMVGLYPGSNHYELHGATMIDLIARAWGISADKIIGGPSWLGTRPFELLAILPDGASTDAIEGMLQKTLAERFGLVIHNDTRPVTAFAITAAKTGIKMKKSEGSQEMGCRQAEQSSSAFVCKNMTIPQFAQWAETRAAAYLAGTSLVDRSNLPGAWDFTLKFSQPNQLTDAGSEGISFFDAAEKQLGLKIDLTKIPQPVIVVDKVNENPSATPPEALKLLTGPTEFELAVIKPSASDSTQGSTTPLPGGRLEIRHASIQRMIMMAWGLWDNKIVGAPPFANTKYFDVIAKAPVEDSTSGLSVSSMEAMLQNLLKKRFGLVAHNEERMGDVFVLAATKPKLKAADPSNRPECKNGPSGNAMRNRMVICQNVTMSQFADQLLTFAGGYLDGEPPVDSTGLDGAFDFTLNFSGLGIWQRASSTRAATGADTTPDPAGAISLQDAIQQQLGLKLEIQKRPTTVLVIDRVNETPTDN